MTKNNIEDHLAWLINCGSLQPQQPVPALQFTGGSNASPTFSDGPPSSQRAEGIYGETSGGSVGNSDVSIFPSEPEFIRPVLPASALKTQGKDAMARLQAGSKSSHKPRLLSESIPLSLQTPTAPSTRAPGTSLKDRYSAQWERKAPGKDNRNLRVLYS